MENSEYELMFREEERHWWFRTKRRIVFDQIRRNFRAGGSEPRILDVGAGSGIVLEEHSRMGDACGIEASPVAVAWARRRNVGFVIRADAVALPFPDSAFDIVTCLDVLYHRNIRDDAAAIEEIYRVLKPGGLFVMTDSALGVLWSRHDEIMGAARRYHRGPLEKSLRLAGFSIIRISYMNFLLFPFVFFKRKILNVFSGGGSDVGRVNPVINTALKIIFGCELYLLRYMALPVGSSIIAVAVKPV